LLRRIGEEGFYVGDGRDHVVGREAGQESLAIALPSDSGVEEDKYAAVFQRAEEAAGTLPPSLRGGDTM
jgi:hypothetical protein